MGIELGRYSYVMSCCEPFIGGRVVVGNFTCLASGVTFMDGIINHSAIGSPGAVSTFTFHEHFPPTRGTRAFPWTASAGDIHIGSDVWIESNVTIFGGSTIGDGAIITACSFVKGDVPPYTVFSGVPARLARHRYEGLRQELGDAGLEALTARLLAIKWWAWPDELIARRLGDFGDVRRFAERYFNG